MADVTTSQSSLAVWLRDAEGCPAPVRAIAPLDDRSGLIRIDTPDFDTSNINASAGRLDVVDLLKGKAFAAQLVACVDTGRDALVWVASPLGKIEQDCEPSRDEDYLVLPDAPPLRLDALVTARSQCPRGPHWRCELPASAWACLPVREASCTCARQGKQPGLDLSRITTGQPRQTWALKAVRSGDDSPLGLISGEIVRLRQRERFRVAIERSAVVSDTAAALGHIHATISWQPA